MTSTIIAGIIAISAQMIFKPAISNFLGWVLITFKKPFRVNDFIRSGEYEGVVISKNFNGITLKQTDESIVILPNALVTSNPVINKSAGNCRPFSTVFTLSNGLSFDNLTFLIGRIEKEISVNTSWSNGLVKIRRISEAGIEIKVQAYCTCNARYRIAKNYLLGAINNVIPASAWPPIDINVNMERGNPCP